MLQGKKGMSDEVTIYMLCKEFHRLPSEIKEEDAHDIQDLLQILSMQRFLEEKEVKKAKKK